MKKFRSKKNNETFVYEICQINGCNLILNKPLKGQNLLKTRF
jgi:hypothetical protein